jgi:site-specific DNA-methyltransferase (adenine-specific)/modification methylase
MLGRWHEVFDPVFDTFQFFVWHKVNPVPKIRKQGFLNSCELIVCMWNKGHTWNFGRQNEMHNFFEAPICMKPERLKEPKHPTQKPLRLLRHLTGIASSPGDTILDPFMGVGSTGVAALEMDRRFIGMELDDTYYNAAQSRISGVQVDPALVENDC